MGYYFKDQYYTTLNVADFKGITTPIIIVNNESITFDFQDYRQVNEKVYITLEKNEDYIRKEQNNTQGIILESAELKIEDCLHKINIDFQDGTKKTYKRPLTGTDKSWLKINHTFKFQDDNFTKNIGEIIIECYNLYLDEVEKIKVPFKLQQLSSQNVGIDLELISANLDNQRNISYVFNERTNNQIFLARQKKS